MSGKTHISISGFTLGILGVAYMHHLQGRKASKINSSAGKDSTSEFSPLSAFTVPIATSPKVASKRGPVFDSNLMLPSVRVPPHSRACVSELDFNA